MAAGTSTLSTPVPARAITRSFGAAAISASVTCVALRTTSASASARSRARSAGGAAGLGVDGAAGEALEQSDGGGRQLIGNDDVHGMRRALLAVNVASGVGRSDTFAARLLDAPGNHALGIRSTKYNLPSRTHRTRRTIVVQTGRSADLTRIRGLFASDFHNLFHSFCEDPANARRGRDLIFCLCRLSRF